MAEGKSSSKNPLIFQLEQDVQNLQRLLEEEIKLHAILENAVDDVAVKISDASCLRNDAQELFCNISSLETSVGKLEEEIISLKFQLIQERNERRLFEYQLKQLSGSTRSMHQNDQVNMDNALIEEEEYLKMIHKFGKLKPMPHRLSNQPNLLSEEIVRCMKNIFISLADSSTLPSNLYSSDSFHSSSSPQGNISTFWPISELTAISFWRQSPQHDIQSYKEVLTSGSIFDPYKVHGKLSWTDCGNYGFAKEVSWMSVEKKQLEYASDSLKKLRSLIEQLAEINPIHLSHNEKLAFWINLYNALIMHAYLAYGVPKSDMKLFTLMQKAAYTVGGHSFSAACIEYILLKMKPPAHRPQTALLLALQKLKVSDEQKRSSIDSFEPLVGFALSCGTYSAPAVKVYTPGNVKEELQKAQRDFIRASVGMNSKRKLLIPKMLHSFARGVVDDSDIPIWISRFLPQQQAAVIERCGAQRRQSLLCSRSWEVIPYDSRFRYLFLPDVLP